jgi:o-succinylbenzoate synthase
VAVTRVHLSYKVYRRSFRVPVRTSHGVWAAREGILLRLERDDGCVGFGEIAPIENFRTETLAGALAWCASLPTTPDLARLRELPRGMPCCAAAIAAALAMHDTSDKDDAVGRPTTTSGGKKSLPVATLLPGGVAARDALARASDAGFQTFKLKIGTADFATERSSIARLVEQLPAGARLRLDANGGLDLRAAVRWLEVAAEWPVEFIEQPLSPDADRDLVRLAQDHATPIALDESVRDADDIKRWRDCGWTGVFVIKPSLAGAPDELVREVRIAPDAFVFSSALETAIGARAGLRLAFATGISRALGYGVGAFFDADGLGGDVARSEIAVTELASWNLEDTWNRL